MKRITNNLVLRKDDYSLLTEYFRNARPQSTYNSSDANELQEELKKATLVESDEFPSDVVGLNSKVRIKTDGKNEVMELTIVTPANANKEKKISVMAPIGAALIGFRQGQRVKWKVPAGNKTFTILEVMND